MVGEKTVLEVQFAMCCKQKWYLALNSRKQVIVRAMCYILGWKLETKKYVDAIAYHATVLQLRKAEEKKIIA